MYRPSGYPTTSKEKTIAKKQNTYAKRQREMQKKFKAEAKLQRRQEKKQAAADGDGNPESAGTPAAPDEPV